MIFLHKKVFIPARQLVTSILFFISVFSANGQSARALLVAVDKYPEQNGWNDIHATNDIKLIEPILHRTGFASQNITILTNEQATKAAIIKALEMLATHSRSGDYIYIHFSCHGQQMADNNGDEVDGLDEVLIPYDAQRRYIKEVYEGANHLRDDELGLLLDAMRLKVGGKGSLLLSLDACHSGTANRDYDDDAYVRGTTYIFAPPDFVPSQTNSKPFMEQITSHPQMGTLTVIAACHPDQLNYEYRCPSSGNYYGSLSYALSRIWQDGKPLSVAALRTTLVAQMTLLKPRRGKTQTPLLQTSDEKRAFKIGL